MQLENAGKRITKVVIKKNQEVIINFSDLSTLKVHESIYLKNYYYVDKIIPVEEIKELETEQRFLKARKYLSTLLSKGFYSSHTIRSKLINLKKLTPEEADLLISDLINSGILLDNIYLQQFKDEADYRLLGKYKILTKLKEKGFKESELSTLTFDQEEEKAKEFLNHLLLKKSIKNYQGEIEYLISKLINQGYDMELASRLVKNLNIPYDEFNEMEILKKDYQKALRKYDRIEDEKKAQKIISYLLSRKYRYEDIIQILRSEKNG